MNNKTTLELIENGYVIIDDCLDKKLIDSIKSNINNNLISILKENNADHSNDLSKNYYQVKKLIPQYKIQVLLAKKLVNEGLITKIFSSKKIFEELIILLGPDIEYVSDFELAINDKNVTNDDYLLKKYHQEFWSGMGLEAIQLWIPIHVLDGMGAIEIIKKSHTWGHIPHRNREPLEIPKNHESEIINVKAGSVVIMSALTLHRTVKNNHNEPRIALPIGVRNFYYPNTGNLDLFNFKKLNLSFFSKMRRILGNPHYSPFRTLNQKRNDMFGKDDD